VRDLNVESCLKSNSDRYAKQELMSVIWNYYNIVICSMPNMAISGSIYIYIPMFGGITEPQRASGDCSQNT